MMSDEKIKEKSIWRHPITVAFVSTVVFGIVVTFIGAWLQHRNWIKQEQLSRQKTEQEKIFDKKAQLVGEIFYNLKNREINAWSLFGACKQNDYDRHNKYWDERTKIISRDAAMRHSIAIYFGYSENDELLKTIWKINKIWSEVEEKLSYHPDCKKITRAEMNKISKTESNFESMIIEVLKKRNLYLLKFD